MKRNPGVYIKYKYDPLEIDIDSFQMQILDLNHTLVEWEVHSTQK